MVVVVLSERVVRGGDGGGSGGGGGSAGCGCTLDTQLTQVGCAKGDLESKASLLSQSVE